MSETMPEEVRVKTSNELVRELNAAIVQLTPEDLDGDIGKGILAFKERHKDLMFTGANPFATQENPEDALTDAYKLLQAKVTELTGIVESRKPAVSTDQPNV